MELLLLIVALDVALATKRAHMVGKSKFIILKVIVTQVLEV